MSLPPLTSFNGSPIEAISTLPASGNGAGLILVGDGTLPPDRLTALCEEFSREGFFAVCPLLFKERETAPDPENEERLLLSVLAYMRKLPGCSGKVGVLGIGRGSLLAFLMAARCDVDCAVLYGCEGIESYLGELSDIRMPVLALMGGQAGAQPEQTENKLLHRFKRNAFVTPVFYDGVGLDFFRIDKPAFDATAARAAHGQTRAFLAEHLKG